jgi:hypothetical protein
MSSFQQFVDGKRCLVLVDAILDIDAVREKLTDAGLTHSAYLLDMAKLDLIASLYRVPEQKMSPYVKRLFAKTGLQLSAMQGASDGE